MAANQDDSKDEYLDIGRNLRFYGNLRFAQLTLFFAITAALLTIIFAINPPLDDLARYIVKFVGLVITFLFWLIEQSSNRYWIYYINRAQVLEIDLGYFQYIGRNPKIRKQHWIWKYFNATNAVRGIFLMMFIFWAIVFFWHPLF